MGSKVSAMKTILSLILCLGMLVSVTGVSAQTQDVTTLQGVLLNPDGTPLADGSYTLVVRVYTSPDTTTPVFTYEGISAQQRLGAFSVLLTLAPLQQHLTAPALWFGISVDGGTELKPRIRVGSVPVASHARTAARAPGAIPVAGICSYVGSLDKLSSEWLPCDGRGLSSVDYPIIFAAIGTEFGNASDDGDEKTDFNLPDMRGRMAIGTGDNDSYDATMEPGSTNRWSVGATSPSSRKGWDGTVKGSSLQSARIQASLPVMFVHTIIRVR